MLEANNHKQKFLYKPYTAAIYSGVFVFWSMAAAVILRDHFKHLDSSGFHGGGVPTGEAMVIVSIISVILIPICWVVVLPLAFAEIWVANRYRLRTGVTYPLISGIVIGTPVALFVLSYFPGPTLVWFFALSFISALPSFVGGYVFHFVKLRVVAKSANSVGQENSS